MGVDGTLYQIQSDSWLLIGYHPKKLPDAVRNYEVAELELTGLYINFHGLIHILKNRYFKILVDHKAIEYMKTWTNNQKTNGIIT